MSTKETQQALIANMKKWQKIEDASVASTGNIIAKTDNALIRLVAQIIQADSQLHRRVQEFIVCSMTHDPVTLTPDELGEIWGSVEQHIAIEKQMVGFVRETLAALKGKHMVVQEYLLNYLHEDEKKHDLLLESLEKIKKGMYPYG